MYKNIYLTFKQFTNSPFIKALSFKAPFVFFSYHLIAPLLESEGDNEPLPCRHDKVGRSKPPPVLTSGFNRLKQPRSICQKVVNTGQYESEWSIENSKGCFCDGLRYLLRFYVLSIEKKNTVLSLPRALFMVRFTSQDLSTEFCITVHAPTLVFLAS